MAWMGQKPDPEPARPAPAPAPPRAVPGPQSYAPPLERERRERSEVTEMANIGKSLQIKGEVTGDEDLTIEGKVDGKIVLGGHHVVIGQNGHVSAEIQAKSVVVGGEVRGNITVEDKVEVAATGTMLGDIRAPRVVLADGARFKGSIDMESATGSGAASAGKSAAFAAPPRPAGG